MKEWFFYFIRFSLIIFYCSVWLGFELFGLRVQVCCQLVQFTLTRKGYDNLHCHNKPQTVNGAGVCMTSCSEEMDWEFIRFWKRFSWGPTMVLRSWGPTMVLRSWGPTMVLRSWGPTMVLRSWGPTMVLRSWGPTMVLRSWSPTMVLRSWGPTMVLRSWGPTMVLRSWGPTMVLRSWGPTMVLRSWGPTMVLRSWGPTMVLRSWGPTMLLRSWSLTMELRIRDWNMQADNWASAIGAENGVLCDRVVFSTVAVVVKFCGSRPAKMNWGLKHHKMCRSLGVLLA